MSDSAREFDAETVRRVGRLARLELADDEVSVYASQLGRILEYVRQLDEVDVGDLEPMAHAVEITNRFRDDEPGEALSREDALSNAPATDGRSFLVPPILDAD